MVGAAARRDWPSVGSRQDSRAGEGTPRPVEELRATFDRADEG